ncbi:MAG TPA: preprotein translocase subunit YajC [Candidatus Cloacimonas sp.]|jgi:preprotein translocase subunit YajC|nr:preprotein translocase subunit YajC [Candidatus Cloacimonas sp.]HPS60115.1 preprotein translocase subunit YajC [Candidatus Cloacimonas sp.]
MNYILLEAAATTSSQQSGAATTSSQSGSAATTLIFMVIMFVILYLLLIRPQQKKAKETQKMQEALKVNDKVLTSSGIYGRVVSLKPDKGIVVLEIDDTNKVRIDIQRNAIVGVVATTEPGTEK